MRLEAKARELVISGRANELRVKVVPFSEAAQAFWNWADGEYWEHPNSAKAAAYVFRQPDTVLRQVAR
jgi:hypothetical protein